jgi:hypothetical protein
MCNRSVKATAKRVREAAIACRQAAAVTAACAFDRGHARWVTSIQLQLLQLVVAVGRQHSLRTSSRFMMRDNAGYQITRPQDRGVHIVCAGTLTTHLQTLAFYHTRRSLCDSQVNPRLLACKNLEHQHTKHEHIGHFRVNVVL